MSISLLTLIVVFCIAVAGSYQLKSLKLFLFVALQFTPLYLKLLGVDLMSFYTTGVVLIGSVIWFLKDSDTQTEKRYYAFIFFPLIINFLSALLSLPFLWFIKSLVVLSLFGVVKVFLGDFEKSRKILLLFPLFLILEGSIRFVKYFWQ